MTDEPTKAAIERWHNLVFGDADVSFDEMNRQRRGMIGATEACRYLDQVSETAKVCAQSATADAERYRLLQPFILPDPEPDVLQDLIDAMDGERINPDAQERILSVLNGYAITKTGEAGQ